jgi:IS30 family transposase
MSANFVDYVFTAIYSNSCSYLMAKRKVGHTNKRVPYSKGGANSSAMGTLVERTIRLLMLVKLPVVKPASASNVLQGFTDKLLSIACR